MTDIKLIGENNYGQPTLSHGEIFQQKECAQDEILDVVEALNLNGRFQHLTIRPSHEAVMGFMHAIQNDVLETAQPNLIDPESRRRRKRERASSMKNGPVKQGSEPRYGIDPLHRLKAWETRRLMANGLDCPVTVIDRTGLAVTISPLRSVFDGDFLTQPDTFGIKTINTISSESWINTGQAENNGHEDAKLVAKTAENPNVERMRHNPTLPSMESIYHRTNLDYAFTYADLKKYFSIYSYELDLIVTLETDPAKFPMHPKHTQAISDSILKSDPMVDHACGYQARLILVDNSGVTTNRYINVNGQVYTIRPVTSVSIPEGMWSISTPANTEKNQYHQSPEITYASLDEMDKVFHLYQDFDDALIEGNPEKIAKRQDLQIKKELQDSKTRQAEMERDMTLLRQAHDLEIQRLERENLLAKRESEERRYRHEQVKAGHEIRTIRHKTFLDSLKNIPALLTALGGFALSLISFFRRS